MANYVIHKGPGGHLYTPPQMLTLARKENIVVAPFRELTEFIANRNSLANADDMKLAGGRRVLTDIFLVQAKKPLEEVVRVSVGKIQYELIIPFCHRDRTGLILVATRDDTFQSTPSSDGRKATIEYNRDHSIFINDAVEAGYGKLMGVTLSWFVGDRGAEQYETVFPRGKSVILKDIPLGKGIEYREVVKGDSQFGYLTLSFDKRMVLFGSTMGGEHIVIRDTDAEAVKNAVKTTTPPKATVAPERVGGGGDQVSG